MKRYCRMAVVGTALLVVPFMMLANPGMVAGASGPDSGRFVLFQGSYTTFDLKRKETNLSQAVFLLDSHTGEVKRYINKIDENGVISRPGYLLISRQPKNAD